MENIIHERKKSQTSVLSILKQKPLFDHKNSYKYYIRHKDVIFLKAF